MGSGGTGQILIICGNILCVISLVLIAASIGTDRWLVFTVDRNQFTAADRAATDMGAAALYTHTRQRGMFRECYPGSDTAFLATAKGVVDKNCFMLRFTDNISGSTSNYKLKIGLYTAFMALFVVSEFLLLVTYVVGFFLCVQKKRSGIWIAALLAFFSVFLFVLGLAFFHFSWHLEQYNVTDVLPGRQSFYTQWKQYLKTATTIDYSDSYICAVTGIFFAVLALICFTVASLSNKTPKRKTEHYRHHHQPQTDRRNYGQSPPLVVHPASPPIPAPKHILYLDQPAYSSQPNIIANGLNGELPHKGYQTVPAKVYTVPPKEVYERRPAEVYGGETDDDRVYFVEHKPEEEYDQRRRSKHRSRHRHEELPSEGRQKRELDLLQMSDNRPSEFKPEPPIDEIFLY